MEPPENTSSFTSPVVVLLQLSEGTSRLPDHPRLSSFGGVMAADSISSNPHCQYVFHAGGVDIRAAARALQRRLGALAQVSQVNYGSAWQVAEYFVKAALQGLCQPLHGHATC